jgi:C1A family cysteine protease
MKAFLALLLLSFVFAALAQDSVTQQFIAFQHKYNKNYATKEEYNYRLAVFHKNLKHIEHKNRKAGGMTQFAVNHFSDMTKEEFKNTILMTKLPPAIPVESGPYHNESFKGMAIPTSFDWRNTPGVVTPIYNQGDCGSCWAFSATENIESQCALGSHGLTSLSMQQIVSCDTTDYGCGGGWPYHAYAYVASAGGQDSYSSYPYTAENTPCDFIQADIVAELNPSDSWTYVTQSQDESEMATYLVAHGPLSVCVDASEWSSYSSGVFMASECTTSIDHCVDAVGYNTAANPPYWIIRNSWGTDWGMSGYMYLQYGADACAVAQVVTNSLIE